LASCLKISCELPSYLDNELSHSEKLIVEKHIQECPSCRRELSQYQKCAADLYEQFSPHRMQHDVKQYVMEHLPELDYSTRDVAGLNQRAKHPSIWRERAIRLIPVGFATVLVVLAFLISEQWPTDDAWHEHVVGVVSNVSGNVVRLSDFGMTEDTTDLKQFSSKGDSIRTAKDSHAIVTLKGGTDITLDEGSAITFQDNRQVRMDSGQAYFNVTPANQLFRVLTPYGDITVFGTQFNVVVDSESVRVDVTEGVVRFEKDQMYETLKKGESVEVRSKTRRLQSTYSPAVAERSLWAKKIVPNNLVKSNFIARYDALPPKTELSAEKAFNFLDINNIPLKAIELKWNQSLGSNYDLAGYHVYVTSFEEEEIFHRFIEPSEFRNARNGRLIIENNGKRKLRAKSMYVRVVPDISYGEEKIIFSGCKAILDLE